MPPGVRTTGGIGREWVGPFSPTTLVEDEAPIQGCSRCGVIGRLIPAYYGPELCRGCAHDDARAFDAEASWPATWWDISLPKHVAVIGPLGLYHLDTLRTHWGNSIEALGALAEAFGITQFWVHESALASLGFPREIDTGRRPAPVPHAFCSQAGDWQSSRPGLKAWGYWWKKGGSGFDLHIPAYRLDHPFAGTGSPLELLCHVAHFDRATKGVRWCGSGSITSDVFLRGQLGKRAGSSAVPPPVQHRWALEEQYSWHRRPGPDEQGFRYVHGLDLNLAYANAASSLELPTGEPHRVDWPKVDARVPGVYLFDPGEWPADLPPPWKVNNFYRPEDGSVWVTTPTAERLAQVGLEPLEGWVWENHGRHLRGWYEMLRDARADVLELGGPALDAVKEIARRGLGRLASEDRTLRGTEYLEDDPLFQPYWNWAVVAETRCRLQRRISELEVKPVAVDVDCLYFLSSRPSPAYLGARIGLPMGDGLGQFKAHGTGKAKDAMRVLELEDHAQAVAALRELVK